MSKIVKLFSNVYATPTGFRFGAKGKVTPASEVYSSLSKGEARRLRKAAYKAGMIKHAAMPRITGVISAI